MTYYGSQRCVGCSGEDCVCCEVYLEERASQRYAYEYDGYDYDDYDDNHYDDDYDFDNDGQPSEYEEWQDVYGGDVEEYGTFGEYDNENFC